MKKKDLKDLRIKMPQELRKQVAGKVAEIDKVRVELRAGRQKNTRVLKTARQDLARLQTILKEMER